MITTEDLGGIDETLRHHGHLGDYQGNHAAVRV